MSACRIRACLLHRASKCTGKHATTMPCRHHPRCPVILLLVALVLLHSTKLRSTATAPWVALLGAATAPPPIFPVSIATDSKLRGSLSNMISAAGRQTAGLLVRPCHTPTAAVIVIPRRIATVTARRSDHIGMRLNGVGSVNRDAEATKMTVLSTSDAVPLKPQWRPKDAGQTTVPSASQTVVCGAYRCVR